jgi:hypothetical protein
MYSITDERSLKELEYHLERAGRMKGGAYPAIVVGYVVWRYFGTCLTLPYLEISAIWLLNGRCPKNKVKPWLRNTMQCGSRLGK